MTRRLSDHDITRILDGAPPAGAIEYCDVARAIAEFRVLAHEAVPTPSAALLSRLDLPVRADLSSPAPLTLEPAPADSQGHQKEYLPMFDKIPHVRLAAIISATTGALVLGLAGAGAAGALPGGLQEIYNSGSMSSERASNTEPSTVSDDAVSDATERAAAERATQSGDASDSGVSGETFGSMVRDLQEEESGAEFGAAVAELATSGPLLPAVAGDVLDSLEVGSGAGAGAVAENAPAELPVEIPQPGAGARP
jgi:hypothetical protein